MRISGEMGLGPLDEKEATMGAITSFLVSPTKIVAIGFLKKVIISMMDTVAFLRMIIGKQIG